MCVCTGDKFTRLAWALFACQTTEQYQISVTNWAMSYFRGRTEQICPLLFPLERRPASICCCLSTRTSTCRCQLHVHEYAISSLLEKYSVPTAHTHFEWQLEALEDRWLLVFYCRIDWISNRTSRHSFHEWVSANVQAWWLEQENKMSSPIGHRRIPQRKFAHLHLYQAC